MVENMSCLSLDLAALVAPLCEAPPEQTLVLESRSSSFEIIAEKTQYDECAPRLGCSLLQEPHFPGSVASAEVPKPVSVLDPVSVLLLTANLWAYQTSNPEKDKYFSTPHLFERLTLAAQIFSRELASADPANSMPKFLFLTEVWHKYSWVKLMEQLNRSGLPFYESQNLYFSDLGAGNNDLGLVVTDGAIIKDATFKPFTWQGSDRTECGRRLADDAHVMGIGLAVVELPNGQEICVEVDHPIHRRKEESGFEDIKAEYSVERGWLQVEAEQLRREWGKCEGLPLVRGGDFNMRPGQWEYDSINQKLNLGFVRSFDLIKPEPPAVKEPCSYCDGNQWGTGENEGVIDHFMGNAFVAMKSAKIVDGSSYSDHNALLVSAQIFRQPQRPWAKTGMPVLPDETLSEMQNYFERVKFPDLACILLASDNLARKADVLQQIAGLRELSPTLTLRFP